MQLSPITRYYCAKSFGHWDVSSYNNKTVFVYQTPYSLLYATINPTNHTCYETTIYTSLFGIMYSRVNFLNSSYITTIFADNGKSSIHIATTNINTGYSTIDTVCDRDCRGIGISKSHSSTSIIWNKNNYTCAATHAANFLDNTNTTFNVDSSCAYFDWQQSITINGNSTIAAWVEKNLTTAAHTVTVQMFPHPPLSVNIYSRNAFSPRISTTEHITGITYQGSTATQESNFVFRALDAAGNFLTPEIPALNVTTASNVEIFGLHGIFAITYTIIKSNQDYNPGFVQLIRTNGTSIGQPFFVGNISRASTAQIRTTTYDHFFTFTYPENYNDTLVLSSRTLDVLPFIELKKTPPSTHTETLNKTTTTTQHLTPTLQQHASTTLTSPPSKTTGNTQTSSTTDTTSTTLKPSTSTSTTATVSPSLIYEPDTPPPTTEAPAITIETSAPEIAPNITKAIPASVTVTAETSASIASVISFSTLSHSNVAMVQRNQLTARVTSCNILLPGNKTSVELEQYDWTINPLRLSIGDDDTQYAAGTLVGNLVLFTGLALTAYFIAPTVIAWGASSIPFLLKVLPHLPSAFIVADFFLTPSIATASAVLIKFSPLGWWQAAGYASYVLQAIKIGYLGYQLKKVITPFVDGDWVFEDKQSFAFKHVYQDYRKTDSALSPHITIPILDQLTNVATGALAGWMPDSLSQCTSTKYIATAIYSTYSIALIIYRPYNNKFDNLFYITVSLGQTTPLILSSIQEISPELKDNKDMNTAIEVLPVAVNFALTGKTLFDMGTGIYSLCNPPKKESDTQNTQGQHTAVTVPTDNSNTAPLLGAVPQKDTSAQNHPTQHAKPKPAADYSHARAHQAAQKPNPLNADTHQKQPKYSEGHYSKQHVDSSGYKQPHSHYDHFCDTRPHYPHGHTFHQEDDL